MSYDVLLQYYFFAWIFWTSLSIGCLGLLCTHHAVRGSWGLVILRLLESGAKLIPYLGVASLPILLNVATGGHFYHWIHPGNDRVLLWKAGYLNQWGFIGRTIVIFALWTFMQWTLTRSSVKEDRTRNPEEGHFRGSLAAFYLVLFFLSNTIAYTDWVMSLDPHWFSTIFPAWFIVGQGLSVLAFCTFYTMRRAHQHPWKEAITPQFKRDMGNLSLTFTLLWAYFSVSQFLIMYSGNLPEEITYYAKRMNDPNLSFMGAGLILFQWFVPFLCELSPRVKREPRLLLMLASLILTMRFFDFFWTIAPFFKETTAPITITEMLFYLVAFVAGGAIWIGGFTAFMKRETPLPSHDERLQITTGAVSHG